MNVEGPRRPPLFLIAMALLAIVSLGLGVVNQVGQQAIQSQRNDDRIKSDLASCNSGNVVRTKVKDGFTAVDESINGIIDTLFANVSPERAAAAAALRAKLEGPLSKLDKAKTSIQVRDCRKEILGAITEK